MESLIVLVLAVLGIFIAWKVLKGVVKTVTLVVILIAAAIFVFGGLG